MASKHARSPFGEGSAAVAAKKSRPGGAAAVAGREPQIPCGVELNRADCDLDFEISANSLQGHALHHEGFAYCWSGARATVGITRGKYCFGCKIISAQSVDMADTPLDQQHVCRVGISRGDDPVGNLGESSHSYGFGGTGKFSNSGRFSDYGTKFGIGDTVVCAVDLESSPLASIGFSKNGKWLGIAWKFDANSIGLGANGASPRKLPWEYSLFPHILLKNVEVKLQFSLEDGLTPEEGYKPWNRALQDVNATRGPSFSSLKECEVLMMVGLPASGKTTWADKWAKEHPEKRYVILGTNLALDQMKVPGLVRKQNYGERFERLMDRATGIFYTLLSRASKTPRNYILDQTNVYKNARNRKLKSFVDFRKIAIVIFPTPIELKARSERRSRENGKEVPADAVNEMLANYVLPTSKDMFRSSECFDEVIFPELDRVESQKLLDEMKQALGSTDLKCRRNLSFDSREGSLQSMAPSSSINRGIGSDSIGCMQNSMSASYLADCNTLRPPTVRATYPCYDSDVDSEICGQNSGPSRHYSEYGKSFHTREEPGRHGSFAGVSGPPLDETPSPHTSYLGLSPYVKNEYGRGSMGITDLSPNSDAMRVGLESTASFDIPRLEHAGFRRPIDGSYGNYFDYRRDSRMGYEPGSHRNYSDHLSPSYGNGRRYVNSDIASDQRYEQADPTRRPHMESPASFSGKFSVLNTPPFDARSRQFGSPQYSQAVWRPVHEWRSPAGGSQGTPRPLVSPRPPYGTPPF